MTTRRALWGFGLVVALGLFVSACGSSNKSATTPDGDDDGDTDVVDGDALPDGDSGGADFDLDQAYPPSHTEVLGGTHHLPGAENARVACSDCHGESLQGLYGQSCYSCHDGGDHTLLLGSQKHKAGSPSTCERCHAPSGNGLAPNCATCHGGDSLAPPADHTDLQGSAKHKPGKDDPLVNCVECHGKDLKGNFGKSCYGCHNNADHTADRGGIKHLSGAQSGCVSCHGPQNKGGLGPACAKCHGSTIHPASHTDNQDGAYHLPGKDDAKTNCTSCHGSDLKGATGKSCYSCHTTADHTLYTATVPHRPGSVDSCKACHGAQNQGSLGPACASCHGSGTIVPTDHTDLEGGTAKHKPGKDDPLANCVACHGATLRGGLAKSCYTCHTATDHTIDREGFMHRAAADTTCVACHGPQNKGGLGPACLPCHMSHGEDRR